MRIDNEKFVRKEATFKVSKKQDDFNSNDEFDIEEEFFFKKLERASRK